MTTEENKKELQNIIQSADEELTNVLMEAAAEYQVATKEDFVVPKEWIEAAEQRLADVRSGKEKVYPHATTMQMLREHLNAIKSTAQ